MFDSFIQFPIPQIESDNEDDVGLHRHQQQQQQRKQIDNQQKQKRKSQGGGLLDLLNSAAESPLSPLSPLPTLPPIIKYKNKNKNNNNNTNYKNNNKNEYQYNEYDSDADNNNDNSNDSDIDRDDNINHSSTTATNTSTTPTISSPPASKQSGLSNSGSRNILTRSGGSITSPKNIISLEKQLNDWQIDFYPSLAYRQKNKLQKQPKKAQQQAPIDNNSTFIYKQQQQQQQTPPPSPSNKYPTGYDENNDLLSKRVTQWQNDINNEIESFAENFIASLPERLKDFHKSSKDRQPLFLTPIITPISGSPSLSPILSSININNNNNNNNNNNLDSSSSSNGSGSSCLLSPTSLPEPLLDDNENVDNSISEEQQPLEHKDSLNVNMMVPTIKIATPPLSPPLPLTPNMEDIDNALDLKKSTDDLETNFQTWRRLFNEKMDQRMKITDLKTHGKIQIN